MTELDKLDKQLLNLLQQDCRLSAELLAEKLNSSRSAIQRRLSRLKNEKAIQSEVAIISNEFQEQKVRAVVEVKLENVSAKILSDFKETMLRHPEIQQCYYVTGKVDFTVIVTADDIPSYEAFTRKIFAENPDIKRYHSNIIAENIKVGLQVPLKET